MGYYVGYTVNKPHKLQFFEHHTQPTRDSHGDKYLAIIGPFITQRAAKWAAKYGQGNPHFTCVNDAEVLSLGGEYE